MRDALGQLIAGQRPDACVVIAELGVNHNGSYETAIRLLHAARQAGADAAKLQLFEPDELCSRVHRDEERGLLARLRLSDRDHARLVAEARVLELPLLATPFDEPSLALLNRLELPLIKLGSGEVTHTPLLARVAATGKPVILSTGGCELEDIERAVGTLRAGGCRALTLLHCTSAYPPPDEQVHLRVIPLLARRFPQCAIGFSDHTLGPTAALAAVALGACVIEKHLTLDRTDLGPDHAASADPREFAALVREARRLEVQLGRAEKRVWPCEGRIGRSCVAARDLPTGHRLTGADLSFKRPGSGVRPYAADELIGRRLTRALRADELIEPNDVV